MPLVVELPNAAPVLKNKYESKIAVEQMFDFGINLGDFISNGSIDHDQFDSVLDGDPVIRHFQNMTINAGHTVCPKNRCKGLFILVEGDLIVNGLLTMTGKGTLSDDKYVGISPGAGFIYFNELNDFGEDPNIVVLEKIGGVGGTFVSASSTSTTHVTRHGIAGSSKFRGSGGGGGGAAQSLAISGTGTKTAKSAAGLPGSVFSGGPGGGGAAGRACSITALAPVDGKGGNGEACAGNWRGKSAATGGAGPSGPGANELQTYSTDGSVTFNTGYGNGAGGLMIILVKGNIIINPTGKISSDGVRAPGISSSNTATTATGGGSGGGIVMLFHKGTVTNSNLISVDGGLGGVGLGALGGAGGAGHKELIPF